MTRRFRIRCGDAIHVAELDAHGGVRFLAHPAAFHEVAAELAYAALSGSRSPEFVGCLRCAAYVLQGRFTAPVGGEDDSRALLATVRGMRLGRRLRRKA